MNKDGFEERDSGSIAIIGMSGRFPLADNLDAFWQNLRNGVDAIAELSEEDLQEEGVPSEVFQHKDYVRAKGLLSNIKGFDADFFSLPPGEAASMDPQQRLFMECAWEALENAGYHPRDAPGLTGVFASSSSNGYFLNAASKLARGGTEAISSILLGTARDFIPTRVSYQLDLKGPSVNVQTACSSSLVAVHLACRALLFYECDLAIAGGVSIGVPHCVGYRHWEGDIKSKSGRCRTFDASADGAVAGEGVGIVVLKRLSEALEQNDTVHAIVRGSAINNDGANKVGFTAPSVDGQSAVIAQALQMAQVSAADISYVEAHGTATPLGDPIEAAALVLAFGSSCAENSCALGSVKTNIGHLDAAAGIAGLIKTVLALRHREPPPSLHFQRLNPRIQFAGTPFYVNSTLREWIVPSGRRLAGVSSFGFGGTNSHVVLEEAPTPQPQPSAHNAHLLVLSARSRVALNRSRHRLAAYLRNHQELDIADVAFTLIVGREAFQHRHAIVCRDLLEAISKLEEPLPTATDPVDARQAEIALLFPELTASDVLLATDLYRADSKFRKEYDRCADVANRNNHISLRPVDGSRASDSQSDERTERLLAFVSSYALGRFWIERGIRPSAVVGDGIGELVAATISGLLSLDEAVRFVCGNGPTNARLESSSRGLSVQRPAIPLLDLAGSPLTQLAFENGKDWSNSTRVPDPVHDNLRRDFPILFSMGPDGLLAPDAVSGLPKAGVDVENATAEILSRLWSSGAFIDGSRTYAGEARRRVPLPPYPFEHVDYWRAPQPTRLNGKTHGKTHDPTGWFYAPVWRRSPLSSEGHETPSEWLLFSGQSELAESVRATLLRRGAKVRLVEPGTEFHQTGENAFTVNPRCQEDYARLLAQLGNFPSMGVIHFWSESNQRDPGDDSSTLEFTLERSYYSILYLTKAIVCHPSQPNVALTVVTRNSQSVSGLERLCPGRATVLGLCTTIPQEHPNVLVRCIDIADGICGSVLGRLAEGLISETVSTSRDRFVAWRSGVRFAQAFSPVSLDENEIAIRELRSEGVYMITGALGRIGSALAAHLVHHLRCRLVLVARPSTAEDEHSQTAAARAREMESLGKDVLLVYGDVASEQDMARAFDLGLQRFGPIQGVIHAAGVTKGPAMPCSIRNLGLGESDQHFNAKVRSLYVLEKVLARYPVDFCLLFSSLAAVLGGLGLGAYAAANRFMDSFASARAHNTSTAWISVNFEGWRWNSRANSRVVGGVGEFALTSQEGMDVFERTARFAPTGQIIVSSGDLTERVQQWIRRPVSVSPTNVSQRSKSSLPGQDELETLVQEAWKEVLGVEEVGADANFFDLNGDSLDATQVISRLTASLGFQVPLHLMYDEPTPRVLAARIGEVASAAVRKRQDQVPIRRSEIPPGHFERLLEEIEASPQKSEEHAE